jgi:hypothetical protein
MSAERQRSRSKLQMKDLRYTHKSCSPPRIPQFWGTLRVENSGSPPNWEVRRAKYGYLLVEFEFPFVRNVLSLRRKIKALLRNDNPFVDFGFPFIINAFALSRKIKAFIMNEAPFVDFGLSFIRNVFALSKKIKAFLMNEAPFVDFENPNSTNEYPFVELGFPLTAKTTLHSNISCCA